MAAWRIGKMRHRAMIYEPSPELDEHGQRTGVDRIYRSNVACSIEMLNGQEFELARQLEIKRAVMIRLNGDPSRCITERNYLKVGTRRFDIISINDLNQDGRKLELLCGEIP